MQYNTLVSIPQHISSIALTSQPQLSYFGMRNTRPISVLSFHNWSNPLNEFPEYQGTCQKERGREKGGTDSKKKKKSPALNRKLFFLTEEHLLHNFFSITISHIPLVCGLEKKGSFSFPLQAQ